MGTSREERRQRIRRLLEWEMDGDPFGGGAADPEPERQHHVQVVVGYVVLSSRREQLFGKNEQLLPSVSSPPSKICVMCSLMDR